MCSVCCVDTQRPTSFLSIFSIQVQYGGVWGPMHPGAAGSEHVDRKEYLFGEYCKDCGVGNGYADDIQNTITSKDEIHVIIYTQLPVRPQ